MPPFNWNEDEAKMALVAQALGHPLRVQLLSALGNDGAFVSELVQALGRPQPHISGHLAVLREAGVVVTERQGTFVRYRLAPNVAELLEALRKVAEAANPSAPSGRRRWRGGWRRGR